MKLYINNEGWGIIRNAAIKCNIVPTGAAEVQPDPSISHVPVSAPFSHEYAIGDFEDQYELDLENTFASLGVDVGTIKAAGYPSQHMYVLHAMQNGLNKELWQHYGRFPELETDDAWKQFPDGYAVVAGLLEYGEASSDGSSHRRSLPFRVRVFLFNINYSLPMPPSSQYNIMLEPEGKKYQVFCPVSHSLKEGEADRIQIRVACQRSATHMFRIRWVLNGGKEAVSGPIVLKHFVPKTWASRKKEQRSVGDQENLAIGEQPNPYGSIGCVEASILQASQIMQARAQFEAHQREQRVPDAGTVSDKQD